MRGPELGPGALGATAVEEHRQPGRGEEEDDEDAGQKEHAHDVGRRRREPRESDRDEHSDPPRLQDRRPLMMPARFRATRKTGTTNETPTTITSLKTKS
jgi:hypothetical protein